MSAQNEGPECQAHKMELREEQKPSYNLVFHNKDGDEVGRLDFNGPGLAFEGIADMSAISFMDWISQVFMGRLKDERNKTREECAVLCEKINGASSLRDAEAIRKEIEK